jgi:putative Mg2+ transporter-C (MgtC) family protein
LTDVVDAAHLGWGEVLARIGVALLVGVIVGVEREADGKDAGTRTHILVALGAATFGLVSVGGFHEFVSGSRDNNLTLDLTRVASYVAAGLGFIGGGTILKHGDHISGLTTAASIWVVGAAGLAAGVGFHQAALVAGVVAALTLAADRPISWVTSRLRPARDSTGRGDGGSHDDAQQVSDSA